nr:translation initiation factor IF-2-like [Anser cygnoides]
MMEICRSPQPSKPDLWGLPRAAHPGGGNAGVWRQEEAERSGAGTVGQPRGSPAPMGPSVPLPTQGQGSGKTTHPSSSTLDGPRRVGKEQVSGGGEASRLTCPQVSATCIPPGAAVGRCPATRAGPWAPRGAPGAPPGAGGRRGAEMRRVPAAPGAGSRAAASSLAAGLKCETLPSLTSPSKWA